MSQNASMSNLIRTFTEIAKSGIAACNLRNAPIGPLGLSHDSQLLFRAPAPPALNPGDDLHPTIRPRS
jgi:hypothetical protein